MLQYCREASKNALKNKKKREKQKEKKAVFSVLLELGRGVVVTNVGL